MISKTFKMKEYKTVKHQTWCQGLKLPKNIKSRILLIPKTHWKSANKAYKTVCTRDIKKKCKMKYKS